MLGIDARVEDLKKAIITDINDANMPACLLNYLLEDILGEVQAQLRNEIERERKEYKEELAKTDESVKASLASGNGKKGEK